MKYTTITLNNTLAVKRGIQNTWADKGVIIIYPKPSNGICFIECINEESEFCNILPTLKKGATIIESSKFNNYIDFRKEIDRVLEQ